MLTRMALPTRFLSGFDLLRAASGCNALPTLRENLPLRLHLAALLRDHGRAPEAEAELRAAHDHLKAAIAQRPADPQHIAPPPTSAPSECDCT